MMRNALVCVMLTLFTTLFVPCAWPQASITTVNGTVQDQTGRVIPGATVTLTRSNTSVTSSTTTNSAGYYIFPGVVPGNYVLDVESAGMAKFEGTLTAVSATPAVVNVTMKIGKTAAVVSVHDITPVVNTSTGTLSTTLDYASLERLPMETRDVTNFLELIPSMQSGGRAMGIRAASFDASLNGAELADRLVYGGGPSDGNITHVQPGLDSINELTVQYNTPSAACSRPTCIVMTTRSGNNRFHGSAFAYNENNGVGLARSRTDYYASPPYLNLNQFGVDVGGPVFIPKVYNGRNKAFWFFSYEARQSLSNSISGYSVPTEAMDEGDFSGLVEANGMLEQLQNPFTTNPSTWSRAPYPGNIIPQSEENPLAKKLLAAVPLPTLPNVDPLVASNWFGPSPKILKQYTTSLRIDENISDKDRIYGVLTKANYRHALFDFGMPLVGGFNAAYPANQETVDAPNWSLALHWTHIVSPTFFNDLLVTGAREAESDATGNPNENYAAPLGLPNPFNGGGWPYMNDAGLDGALNFEGQNTNAWHSFYLTADDNATKIIGKHQLEFGFHFRHDVLNELPDQQFEAGEEDWDSQATSLYDPTTGTISPQPLPYTGDELANFYLGVMGDAYAQMNHSWFYYRQNQYAGYLQDNWRTTSHLTLNLGLRYEYWGPINNTNNSTASFDVATDTLVLGNSLSNLYRYGYTNPQVIDALEGYGMKIETYQQAGYPQSLRITNKDDFAPRLGFAYMFGHGAKSFVLRGGYSIGYFPIPLYPYGARMRKNTPFTFTDEYSVTDPAVSPDGIQNIGMRSVPTVFMGVNSANIISNNPALGLYPGAGNISFNALHTPDPHVQAWNLTLEKEILPGTLLRLGWLGNHSSNMEQLLAINEATPPYIWYLTTGTPLPTGPLSDVATNNYDRLVWSRIEQWQNTAWGNSNGIQVEVQRNYKKGYGYQFFYVLDNNFAAGGQGGLWQSGTSYIPATNQYLPGTMPTNPHQYDQLLDYQRDITTPKHQLTWDFTVGLPFGRGEPFLRNAGGILNKIIGGWQVSAIGSANSNYFQIPNYYFPTGTPIQVYGKKYPIKNCTSGVCYPGYLWSNAGYIPSTLINSHNAAGQPDGYEGIPANYKPAVEPLIPYGQTTLPPNAPPGTNIEDFWGTNTEWVPTSGGVQETTWSGFPAENNQYLPSIWTWDMDAQLAKSIPIKERFTLRLQAAFFNVFNAPGDPPSVGADGTLSTQYSNNSPRTLQISARLTW